MSFSSTCAGPFSPCPLGHRVGRYALTERPGRDPLIERHVLAAELHLQRALELIDADLPPRRTRCPVPAIAGQHIGDRFVETLLVIELAVLERFESKDRERGR